MMKLQAELVVPTCAEFFRYYAGRCTKINGTAYNVRSTGIASARRGRRPCSARALGISMVLSSRVSQWWGFRRPHPVLAQQRP
jgi:hypothetical protein